MTLPAGGRAAKCRDRDAAGIRSLIEHALLAATTWDFAPRHLPGVRGDAIEHVSRPSGRPKPGASTLFGEDVESITRLRSADRREIPRLLDEVHGLCQLPLRHAASQRWQRSRRKQIPSGPSRRGWRSMYHGIGTRAGSAAAWSSAPVFDLEMIIAATGACAGIENYSRHLTGRNRPGRRRRPPYFEYLPKDAHPDHRREPCHRAADRRDVLTATSSARRR